MRVLVLTLLVAAAACAPSAQGQAPAVDAFLTLAVEDPGRALAPGANESIGVLVNYRVGYGAQPSPAPTADVPERTQKTRIDFTAKQVPSWVTAVAFDPPYLEVEVPARAAASQSLASRVSVVLTLAPDAPALQREDIVIEGVAQANGNIKEARGESAPVKLRAMVVGLLNVSHEGEHVVVPGGRWVVVPFTVRNDGNSEITARVNVTLRPENSQVEFEDALTLARGASQVVEVRIRTPWTNAEFGELELEAVPLVDGEDGAAAIAAVEVLGQSAVPGPSLAPVALALGLLALARRRSP